MSSDIHAPHAGISYRKAIKCRKYPPDGSCDMPPQLRELKIVELPPLRLPFWRYFELFRGRAYAFLLDSAMESPRRGRFSFLGGEPIAVFRAKHKSRRCPPPRRIAPIVRFPRNATGELAEQSSEVSAVRADPSRRCGSFLTRIGPPPMAPIRRFRSWAERSATLVMSRAIFSKICLTGATTTSACPTFIWRSQRRFAHCHTTGRTYWCLRGCELETDDAAFERLLQKVAALESDAAHSPHPRPLSGHRPKVGRGRAAKAWPIDSRGHFRHPIAFRQSLRYPARCKR